jgi:hypothetical protein
MSAAAAGCQGSKVDWEQPVGLMYPGHAADWDPPHWDPHLLLLLLLLLLGLVAAARAG